MRASPGFSFPVSFALLSHSATGRNVGSRHSQGSGSTWTWSPRSSQPRSEGCLSGFSKEKNGDSQSLTSQVNTTEWPILSSNQGPGRDLNSKDFLWWGEKNRKNKINFLLSPKFNTLYFFWPLFLVNICARIFYSFPL